MIACGISLPGFACEKPQPVEISSGATATLEEMKAAQTSFRAWYDAMYAYIGCVQDYTARQAAEDEVLAAQEAFNNQVKAFKSAN